MPWLLTRRKHFKLTKTTPINFSAKFKAQHFSEKPWNFVMCEKKANFIKPHKNCTNEKVSNFHLDLTMKYSSALTRISSLFCQLFFCDWIGKEVDLHIDCLCSRNSEESELIEPGKKRLRRRISLGKNYMVLHISDKLVCTQKRSQSRKRQVWTMMN